MKDQEIAEAKIKVLALKNNELDEWKSRHFDLNLGDNSESLDSTLDLSIHLKSLVRIDDIFGDRTAVKKEILKGNSTAKPEKMARIFFEIRIEIENQIIYESLKGDFPILTSNIVNEFAVLEEMETPWKVYLDELKISKLLKNALRRMKK